MRKKLWIAGIAAVLCGANAAYALTSAPPTKCDPQDCDESEDCPVGCNACFPNPLGPHCIYWNPEQQ